MPSERVQRQIDRLLDEAEQAIAAQDRPLVQTLAREVLSLDPDNPDGTASQASAERMLGMGEGGAATPAPEAPVGRGLAPRRPASTPETPAEGAGETPAPPGRAEAMRHLDFAITEFRAMKMQPALERALRHKEVLKA